MSWTRPYIVIRVGEEGRTEIVHSTMGIKDARYWLQYIAMPGDAVFQTPAHPKCNGQGEPIYYAHLVSRGKIRHDQQLWTNEIVRGQSLALPTTDEGAPPKDLRG